MNHSALCIDENGDPVCKPFDNLKDVLSWKPRACKNQVSLLLISN